MSDLISIPPEDESPAGSEITAGDFWPAIDVNDFREAYRVGGPEVTHARLTEALRAGLAIVLKQARTWRITQQEAGHATLAAVTADDEIDGLSLRLISYRQAVSSYAAAYLMETYRGVTATGSGLGRVEEDVLTAADHRRNGHQALSDLIDRDRDTVELI
jgi:hypothetical protein